MYTYSCANSITSLRVLPIYHFPQTTKPANLCKWGCVLNGFMLSSLPCFLFFLFFCFFFFCFVFCFFLADLQYPYLSLHFLSFLVLFVSLFSAAGACLSWSSPSITEQQVCPLRLPQWMYISLRITDYTSVQTLSKQWMKVSPCLQTQQQRAVCL